MYVDWHWLARIGKHLPESAGPARPHQLQTFCFSSIPSLCPRGAINRVNFHFFVACLSIENNLHLHFHLHFAQFSACFLVLCLCARLLLLFLPPILCKLDLEAVFASQLAIFCGQNGPILRFTI